MSRDFYAKFILPIVLSGAMLVVPRLGLSQAPGDKSSASDVDTIEHIVAAFYSAISTPAGGKLDRNRLNGLFIPKGRIAAGIPPSSSRAASVVFLSPDEYAVNSDAQTVTQGFYDRNRANQVQRFGVMAHVYSVYESRFDASDAKPMARGIKSFELLNSADRWYIVQVYWDRERPDNPIPDRYMNDKQNTKQ